MNFEEILKEQATEAASRSAGVEKLQKFLDRVLPESGLDDPEVFFNELQKISVDEFLGVLERINGVLTEIPINERESLVTESGVQNEFFFNSATELVPPPLETRKRLMQETLSNLQSQLAGQIPDDIRDQENLENVREVVARTLFNTIIYLHPFGDGNGRTARTTYYALTPQLQNKSTAELVNRLTNRPESLREYHQLLNQSTLEEMLDGRDIKWNFTETPHLPLFNTDNPTRGLDADHLRFIAAFDVMSDKERDQYITKGNNSLVIKQESLPPELVERMDSQLEKIREEFVDSILEFSAYPQKWPDWLQQPFTKAFKHSDTL